MKKSKKNKKLKSIRIANQIKKNKPNYTSSLQNRGFRYHIPSEKLPDDTWELDRAGAELSKGNPHQAFEICRPILIANPNNSVALNLAGVAAFQAGLTEEAIDLLKTALFYAPDYPEAHTNLGNIFAKLNRFEDAEMSYESAMESDPNYSEAFFNFGSLMETNGKYGKAAIAFEKVLKINPEHTAAWHGLGNSYKGLQRLIAAQDAYNKALEIDSSLVKVRTNLAAVLHELREFDLAIEQCEKALELSSDLAEARYNLGSVMQEVGRHSEAIGAYEKVLSAQPSNAAAAMNIAFGLQQMGRLDEANDAFLKTIGIDPDFAKAFVNLADLKLQLGDLRGALAVCDGFLDRHPGDTSVLAFKVVVLNELGEEDEVKQLLNYDRFLKIYKITSSINYLDIEEFNSELSIHIENHPTLTKSPQSHATRDGYHSGELLVEPLGIISDLEKLILLNVEKYIEGIAQFCNPIIFKQKPNRLKLSIWGVVMRSGGHQVPHIHPSAWLSGVYYVKVPDSVVGARDNYSGCISFGVIPNHFHNKKQIISKFIKPESGLLILFPSSYYHQTIPLEEDQKRISIAFDLIDMD